MMTTQLHLIAIDSSCNKSRFYKLLIQKDMWGGCSLVREYGRIGHPGTVLCRWHSTDIEALDSMAKLARQKLKKGYFFISNITNEGLLQNP